MATRTLCQSPSLTTSLGLLAASSSSSTSGYCCALPSQGYGVPPLQFSSAAFEQMRSRRHSLFVHVVAEEAEAFVAPPSGLTMNLKVEGTLADSLIPKVADILKNVEGVSNLKVYTSEGVATVELEKQTTIQATGEASSLLEKIQGEGFKLQNLSISFDDATADADEDIAYEYESTS
ncbi:hypothetical protein GOP47_0014296 [Adiantum capillus-veneris]|uniref:HMA domain-containing protein n=1 Tax=Adiantum capillus-veneris TaxID=13818 RepID=A0A9D4ZBZ9_ADICA|nr:hypothetical protein GOP47_0014296 [Adiantum capillus-veneris]